MDIEEYKKIPSGVVQIVLGSFIFSPLIYNTEEIVRDYFGWGMVGVGVLLIIPGVLKLIYKISAKRKIVRTNNIASDGTVNRTDSVIISDSKKILKPRTALKGNIYKSSLVRAYGNLMIVLAYVVIALSIIGIICMWLYAKPSEASGVPFGATFLLAGVLYAIGKSCK
jgi:uncharacterized membrane protein HdeD (DUF308 family)